MTILINPARFRLGADTAVGRLLGDEPSGMALDFTTMQALVRDDSFPVIGFLGDVNSLLTYTAPSPKMVWGSDGVMRLGQHNLCLQSQTFDHASWVQNVAPTINATTAPDGTMTADKILEVASTGWQWEYQAVTVTPGTCTFSVYLKAAERNWAYIRAVDNDASFNTYFNLATGTVGNVGTGVTASIQSVGNGWYRCVATRTTALTSGYVMIGITTANGSDVTTGIAGYGIYAWGAQLERNTSPSTYLPTTTATRYGLPLDHDPVTHAPLGVLIEEQRVNLLLQSQTFDNASWSKGAGTTVTANTVTAPDGTMTADTVAITSLGFGAYQLVTYGIAVSSQHTLSVWLRAAAPCTINIGFNGGTNPNNNFGTTANVTTSWQRFSYTLTAPGADTGLYVIISPATLLGAAAQPVPVTVHIWGAQLEAGSFATSYIPTVASQVTRAVDNISLPLAAIPFSATAGTLFLDSGRYSLNAAGLAHTASISDGGWLESFDFSAWGVGYVGPTVVVTDNGAYQANVDSFGAYTVGSPLRMAAAWAANDFAAVATPGGAVKTDTALTLPTVTTLKIGQDYSGTQLLNGHVRELTYLPRRASNAELQVMVG